MELIDRNAVLNRYQEICMGVACMDCPFKKEDGCAVEKLIIDSAVVDAEPVKHGKWNRNKIVYMECSECGWLFEYYGGLEEEWNYCPSCGAKMIPTIPKEIIDAVLGEDEVDDEDN